MPPCGLLNLNKPAGMTSRDVVNIVQRLSRPAKAGHAGTLDPLACGVLVVCVGWATRLIEYVQRMPKRYLGTFLLGRTSVTEDIEGEVTECCGAPAPTREQIELAARRFLGHIEQRPPAFSALKIHGRPAYKLARQGKPVNLKPRPVEVFRIEVKNYQYPELVLEVDCGGGTYIRSLGRDLAEALGTAAVMSALERTSVGGFHIADAAGTGQLDRDNWLTLLQPPLRAVELLPRVQLSADEALRLRNGQTLLLDLERTGWNASGEPIAASHACDEFAALDPAGQLVGIVVRGTTGEWRSSRIMPLAAD